MKGTAQAISIRVEVNQTRESTSIVILDKFEKEFVAGRMWAARNNSREMRNASRLLLRESQKHEIVQIFSCCTIVIPPAADICLCLGSIYIWEKGGRQRHFLLIPFICINTYAYMWTHTHTHTYTHIRKQTHAHVHSYAHTHTHTIPPPYTHAHTNTYTHNINAQKHTHTHTHTQTHTHSHTHTHIPYREYKRTCFMRKKASASLTAFSVVPKIRRSNRGSLRAK